MADHNGHVNGHSKDASEKGIVPDHLSMASNSEHSAEFEPSAIVAEDQIAELLAAYDDALASGSATGASIPHDNLDPDSIAEIELLGAKARAVRRVQKDLLVTRVAASDATHGDYGTSNAASHQLPSQDGSLTETTEFPKTLGRFEIVRELGSGGSGVVMLARDPMLGRFVALKIPRPETLFAKDLRRRFLREAQTASRLTHPNLVPVYEVGEAGSICYIAAAFCDGPNLSEWLSRQSEPVSVTSAATLIAHLADGIDYAHGEGILHRDLKPANVLLEPLPSEREGSTTIADELSRFRPRITDFGLAKVETREAIQTRTGAMLGTLPYLAPEQADAKQGPVCPATDVYGLGVILYELLTGQRPFRGPSEIETLRQVLGDEPTALRTVRADVPRDLEAICLRCLDKNPRKRYPTAAELATDLRRFLAGEPTIARPLTRVQRMLNWTRRRPALASLLAVSTAGTLILVALMAAYIVQLGTARETADLLRADAEASAENAGRYMYASQMRQAYALLDQGDIVRTAQLLDEYKPGSQFAHLRGFEWYHLSRQIHGERLSVNTGHGQVYAVRFSPDGKILATGGQDGSIRFWDPQSGQELASLMGHRGCVNVVAYSPDAQILASASCDHTVKLWQSATHELLATFDDHTDEVHYVAFSPDGRLLASGGHDGIALIRDLATYEVVNRLDTKKWIKEIVWQHGGRSLVLNADDRALLWNLDTNEHSEHCGGVTAIAVSPATADVHVAIVDGSAEIWKPSFSSMTRAYTGHVSGPPKVLAFSKDGDWLASGGDDNVVRVSNQNMPYRQSFFSHTGRVQSLAFSPQNDMLASASFDGTVKLWGPLRSESLPRLTHHYLDTVLSADNLVLYGVAISPDLRYVALRASAGEVCVFDLSNSALVETIAVAPQTATGLDFLPMASGVLFGIWPSGEHLDSNQVVSWDIARNQSIGSLPIPIPARSDGTGPPDRLTLSADGKQLISADTKSVAIADTQSGESWCQFTCKPAADFFSPRINCSPDGNTLGLMLGNEPSCLVDMISRRQRRIGHDRLLAVANGGKFIAVRHPKTSIAIVEPDSGRELCRLPHDSLVVCATFSPDSRTLATSNGEGRVILWNVATGELITSFAPNRLVVRLQFSADGRKLAAIGYIPESRRPQDVEGTVYVFIWEGSDLP